MQQLHQHLLGTDNMRLRDLPIERKLYLIILPICLIPAAVFVTLSGWVSRVGFERAMGHTLVSQASAYANRLDFQIKQRMVGLSRMNPQRLTEMAARRAASSDAPTSASFTDWIDSTLYYAAPGPTAQQFPRRWRTNQPAQLPETFVNYCFEHRSELTPQGNVMEVNLPTPGKPEARVPYAVMMFPAERGGIMFHVARTERILNNYLASLSTGSELLLIYSRIGGVLYKSGTIPEDFINDLQAHHRSGEYFKKVIGDKTYLMACAQAEPGLRTPSPLLGSSWAFVVQYDMGDFLGMQDTLMWLSVLIGLGLVLLMLGLASLSARWVARPLSALKDQADRLAQGDLAVRARVSSRDEIGALGEAFNTMAGRLRATYQSLEERVEESRLRAEHIHLINEIAAAIIRALSLDDIFNILRRELEKVFVFDAIWISRLESGNTSLRITQISPMGLVSLGVRTAIPMEGSLHGRVIAGQETLRAEIGPQHRVGFFETRIFNAEGYQSYLIAPLPARKGIIGTLTVASMAPDAYNAELADVLTSLARTVAIAIEQADLFAQISHFAAELERKVEQRTHELDVANQKLIQAEKYFATGRMAGNLAHEINNPLGIIKNFIQIVRSNLTASGGGRRKTDPNLDSLEVINDEVNRIARLVRQLLDLHRPVEQKIEPVDLNALIREILTIIEEELRRCGIEVVAELQENLPQPVVSSDLIRQVLINLIRNAQDAMEQGGKLTVRTSSTIEWAGGEERTQVIVRISDTGCGIPPEHLSQIFDPFFTTKDPDKGTGLGLCVSYSIVQMYHGSIDLESEVGKGTTVAVTLPMDERSRTWSETVQRGRTNASAES
ncbi:HAMP domain-containing protein [bacterium]|nr:HAMP domain-containing protein [bacterium]